MVNNRGRPYQLLARRLATVLAVVVAAGWAFVLFVDGMFTGDYEDDFVQTGSDRLVFDWLPALAAVLSAFAAAGFLLRLEGVQSRLARAATVLLLAALALAIPVGEAFLSLGGPTGK